MQCSKCGKFLIRNGGISIETKASISKVTRKYDVSEYHYITGEGNRLCEECFNLWWWGVNFKKNKQIFELQKKIWKLEKEMRKDAS